MQILAEPLSLLLVGVLMLVLVDLWQRPTLGRAVLARAISGASALVRSEHILLLAIAVAHVLLVNRLSRATGGSRGRVPQRSARSC